jgi:hypothetical protein
VHVADFMISWAGAMMYPPFFPRILIVSEASCFTSSGVPLGSTPWVSIPPQKVMCFPYSF